MIIIMSILSEKRFAEQIGHICRSLYKIIWFKQHSLNESFIPHGVKHKTIIAGKFSDFFSNISSHKYYTKIAVFTLSSELFFHFFRVNIFPTLLVLSVLLAWIQENHSVSMNLGEDMSKYRKKNKLLTVRISSCSNVFGSP